MNELIWFDEINPEDLEAKRKSDDRDLDNQLSRMDNEFITGSAMKSVGVKKKAKEFMAQGHTRPVARKMAKAYFKDKWGK